MPENALSQCCLLSFSAHLHLLQHRLLELAVLDLLAGVVGGGLAVQREQVAEIELGCLEKFDLADVDLL